jgi:hypothetical protein
MSPDQEFAKRISSALFNLLRVERRTPIEGLKFGGTVYSDSRPGWLNVALFLAENVCSCPLGANTNSWSSSNDMVALVQASMSDLKKAVKKEEDKGPERDAAWIEELKQIWSVLSVWCDNLVITGD